MMRALLLNDEIKQRITDHVAWAERPENWFYPAIDSEPPGDNPAFVLMLEMGFRTVYTHTVAQGHHLRHLSISVEGTLYPDPYASFTIATLFGFTGGVAEHDVTMKPGEDWMMKIDENVRCIEIGQEVAPSTKDASHPENCRPPD